MTEPSNGSTSTQPATKSELIRLKTLFHHPPKQIQRLKRKSISRIPSNQSCSRNRIPLRHSIKQFTRRIQVPTFGLPIHRSSPTHHIPLPYLIKNPSRLIHPPTRCVRIHQRARNHEIRRKQPDNQNLITQALTSPHKVCGLYPIAARLISRYSTTAFRHCSVLASAPREDGIVGTWAFYIYNIGGNRYE